jgi:hypothetical protein
MGEMAFFPGTLWSKRGFLHYNIKKRRALKLNKPKLALITILLSCVFASLAAQQIMYVQVKNAALTAKPIALGTVLAKVPYTQAVTILEKTNASYYKVQYGTLVGYLHVSALTKTKLAMSSTAGTSGYKDDEVAMAGKGFNKEVESQYKQEQGLDYSGVDAVETLVVPENQIQSFLNSGSLSGVQP